MRWYFGGIRWSMRLDNVLRYFRNEVNRERSLSVLPA